MDEEIDYIHHCHICNKAVDFEQVPVPDANGAVMFNFRSPQNKVVLLCSEQCRLAYKMPFCACVVCSEFCFEDCWYVHMKFVKLGGWTSIKAVCSERCRNVVLEKETTEIEVRFACWFCKKLSETKLKKCGKCHLALYCDQECQKKHWPIHKMACGK